LGPSKKVNLIMVGFPADSSEMMGQYQQAKWIGGKKNDLVICYGADAAKASWCYVFGWTEADIVKQNLQSIILAAPVDNNILPAIEKEVYASYVKKDWHKFDYITIQPPNWSYWVYAVVMLIAQSGFWFWACTNEFEKG
jgi:hypothetical protein